MSAVSACGALLPATIVAATQQSTEHSGSRETPSRHCSIQNSTRLMMCFFFLSYFNNRQHPAAGSTSTLPSGTSPRLTNIIAKWQNGVQGIAKHPRHTWQVLGVLVLGVDDLCQLLAIDLLLKHPHAHLEGVCRGESFLICEGHAHAKESCVSRASGKRGG